VEQPLELIIGRKWRRGIPTWRDAFALLIVLTLVILLGLGGGQMVAPFVITHQAQITLSPSALPGYALRTTMRMMAALAASLIFTLTYTTAAGKSRRAEMVLIPLLDVLQSVGANPITGLIETLAAPPCDGESELAQLGRTLSLNVKDLFGIAEAMHILEFAELKEGAIRLTAAGRVFAQCDSDERKRLFREHLLRFVPLAAHIRHVLDDRDDHAAPRVRIESEIEDHMSPEDAEQTLRTIINWARYAEVFSYDDGSQSFTNANAGDQP
jgi:hypothetical protein